MPPETNIINNYVEATITKRNVEYIMLSKRELKMADNTTGAIDICSEALIIIASGLLGYIFNLTPILSKSYIFSIILMLALFFIGFKLRLNKKTLISEILEMDNQEK